MAIHRLLYRSDAALNGCNADVRRQTAGLVESSAIRNAAVGLTGALLLSRGIFIQALEGPLSALEPTFERICCDLRHRRVALLEFVQAEERVFAEWSMVRITTEGSIERLFASADGFLEQNLETIPAQATIQLMRSLLMTGAPQTSSSATSTDSPRKAQGDR